MNWKEVQAKLLVKKSREQCLDFAIACAEKAATFSDSELVQNSLQQIKNDRWKYSGKNFHALAKERALNKENVQKREAAHVLIHATELPSVCSIASIAGHAARAGEALSRIGEEHLNEIVSRFKI